MRILSLPLRSFFLCLLSLLLSSCSSTPNYNPTVYNYKLNDSLLSAKPPQKLLLATVNFGAPTRVHLRKGASRVRAMTRAYLQDHNYQLLPSYLFDNAWKQAIRTYGEVYDPTTGKLDVDTWRKVMSALGSHLKENTDADAIVFADLVEVDVQHSPGMQHFARWDGVTRKPATQGVSQGVPVGFNWTQPIKAASVRVSIYNTDMIRLFSSRGGIETLQAIDLRLSDPAFVRRKKLLKNEDHIEEGIQLAFHPFITMERYPGTPTEQQ